MSNRFLKESIIRLAVLAAQLGLMVYVLSEFIEDLAYYRITRPNVSVFSAGHVQPNGWGDLIRDNLWYSHTSWAHGFELVLLVAGIFVLVDTTHDRARKLMVIGLFLLSFARFVLPVWGPPLEKLGGFGYYPNLRMFFGGWVFPAVALFHARCHGQILGKL